MSNAKKRREKRFRFPAWLFLILYVLFDELLLHLWTAAEFNPLRLTCILLFSGVMATVMAILPALSKKPKVCRGIALVLGFIYTFLMMMEYFLFDTFKVFMSMKDIFNTAGDVAGDFGSTIILVILKGLWRIALVLAPLFLYGYFGKKNNWGRPYGPFVRYALLLGAAVLFLFSYAFSSLFSPDFVTYNSQYTFDGAVHSFGLSTGIRLSLIRSGNGGGFVDVDTTTESTAPSEATEATEAPTESTAEPTPTYGLHEEDIDFEALAEIHKNSDISAVDKYIASLTPASENEYTGLFAGKNLIFITAEAFSAEVIDPELTPTLYRMATKGIQFTDYYQPAWGGSTSTGEYSNLTGLVPTNGVNSIKDTIGNNMYYTIGNQLRRLGYSSGAFHNNTYTYYGRDKTHQNLGYDIYMGLGNGMEEGVQKRWPESDQEMIEFIVPQYIDQQPFSLYFMSVSGHCVYNKTGNMMSVKNYDAVADMDCSETIKCYYAANLELEYAMQSLMHQLYAAGIADETVVVIGTDHYPYGLEEGDAWGNDKDYLPELYGYEATDCFKRDHSRLIIWSACIEDMNLVVDTPTYSLDIVPTLSNLFGVKYDSRLLVGRDVFSDDLPLALWNSYSWKTDKGSYNAANGKFTPNPGVEVDEDYVSTISSIVKNKIYFSKVALNDDYYGVLFDE